MVKASLLLEEVTNDCRDLCPLWRGLMDDLYRDYASVSRWLLEMEKE